MFDMTARRLNLTIPAHFDTLLDELSALSGRAKSSYVLDAVTAQAKHWKDEVARINGVVRRPEARQLAHPTPSVPMAAAEATPALSRQQRRQLERQQQKKEGKI